MRCLAEMLETVSPFGGECGYFISWFGCNAAIRSRRGSPLYPRKKKYLSQRKQLGSCHDSDYGSQSCSYSIPPHYRDCCFLRNKLRNRLASRILGADYWMADENGPAHVS